MRNFIKTEEEVRVVEKEGVKRKVKRKITEARQILREESGMSVIELLLILVVIIALVLIFKNQLINLVNTIFDKITSESAGI